MEISSNSIKINGTFEIPLGVEFEHEHDYPITLQGEISGRSEEPNGDGTISQIWKYRPSTGQIGGTTGQSTPLKDPRRHSQKFRAMVMQVWGMDYDEVMNILLANGNELENWVLQKKI